MSQQILQKHKLQTPNKTITSPKIKTLSNSSLNSKKSTQITASTQIDVNSQKHKRQSQMTATQQSSYSQQQIPKPPTYHQSHHSQNISFKQNFPMKISHSSSRSAVASIGGNISMSANSIGKQQITEEFKQQEENINLPQNIQIGGKQSQANAQSQQNLKIEESSLAQNDHQNGLQQINTNNSQSSKTLIKSKSKNQLFQNQQQQMITDIPQNLLSDQTNRSEKKKQNENCQEIAPSQKITQKGNTKKKIQPGQKPIANISNQENEFQNFTNLIKNKAPSVLSSYRESFAESENFFNIEETLEEELNNLSSNVAQKSLKQMIKEKFLGPALADNGNNSDSLLRRNVLFTNSHLTSGSGNRSNNSSFKSSYIMKNNRENIVKSSFGNCDIICEDTDEHSSEFDRSQNHINGYSFVPKTIFNEIIQGFNNTQHSKSKQNSPQNPKKTKQNEQAASSNMMGDFITQVKQQPQQLKQKNRKSLSPQKSHSTYLNQDLQNLENQDPNKQQPVVKNQSQQEQIQSQQVQQQDDIVEFLQSDTHKMHLIQTLQSLQYVKNFLSKNSPNLQQIQSKQVKLPPFKKSWITKTIIFDLDETLVHCVEDFHLPNGQLKPCDHYITVNFPNGEHANAGLNIRPYAFECLKRACELFQVVVFTASHKSYADVVLDLIDPENKIFDMRLYRDSCMRTIDGVYVKDLRIFQNCRSIDDIVIVDNAVYSFGYQLESGIPIIPFYDDKQDEELLHLMQYLECLVRNGGDIREHNRKAFQLRELSDLDVQQFLQNMMHDQALLEQRVQEQKQNQQQSQSKPILKEQQLQQQNPKTLTVQSQQTHNYYELESEVINEESDEEDEQSERKVNPHVSRINRGSLTLNERSLQNQSILLVNPN